MWLHCQSFLWLTATLSRAHRLHLSSIFCLKSVIKRNCNFKPYKQVVGKRWEKRTTHWFNRCLRRGKANPYTWNPIEQDDSSSHFLILIISVSLLLFLSLPYRPLKNFITQYKSNKQRSVRVQKNNKRCNWHT